MARSCIILPTYNERDNIAGIVGEILALDISDLSILIVDDHSPDGTGQIADALASQDGRVAVLHRDTKDGLGKAYGAGFQWALRDPAIEYVFEMDADFSHQPKYIPLFLQAIQSADVVLGSRYIRTGGVANWHWLRRFISTAANIMIRRLLGVSVHDLTGGFKCFRRQVLERLDLAAVASRGYNFQIEVTYRALQAGFQVKEIPITFIERRAGKSKFSPAIMLESFWQVLRLRFGK